MTPNELADKIAKLPSWAREHIKNLEAKATPNLAEIKELCQKLTHEDTRYRKLSARADAMGEILTCAARGGNETAQAYVARIIEEYKPLEPLD